MFVTAHISNNSYLEMFLFFDNFVLTENTLVISSYYFSLKEFLLVKFYLFKITTKYFMYTFSHSLILFHSFFLNQEIVIMCLNLFIWDYFCIYIFLKYKSKSLNSGFSVFLKSRPVTAVGMLVKKKYLIFYGSLRSEKLMHIK